MKVVLLVALSCLALHYGHGKMFFFFLIMVLWWVWRNLPTPLGFLTEPPVDVKWSSLSLSDPHYGPGTTGRLSRMGMLWYLMMKMMACDAVCFFPLKRVEFTVNERDWVLNFKKKKKKEELKKGNDGATSSAFCAEMKGLFLDLSLWLSLSCFLAKVKSDIWKGEMNPFVFSPEIHLVLGLHSTIRCSGHESSGKRFHYRGSVFMRWPE